MSWTAPLRMRANSTSGRYQSSRPWSLGLSSAWSVLWFLVPGPGAPPRNGGPWTAEWTKHQERRSMDSRYIDLKSVLARGPDQGRFVLHDESALHHEADSLHFADVGQWVAR